MASNNADNGASSYRRFMQGDSAALEELVRLYSDELVRYAFLYVRNADTAEDIMEDTFAALIVKKRKFDGTYSFKSYLYAIARNKCMDFLRSKHRKNLPLDEIETVLPPAADDTERALLQRERDRVVYKGLQSLPPQYRDVLYLTYFDGFSLEEARRILGKSRKQMYNLLSRARLSLKDILIQEGIGYEDI